MLEKMNALLPYLVVSGAERRLAEQITRLAQEADLKSQVDLQGNVLVSRQKSTEPFRTILFVPMDLPGYLCLHAESEKAYLVPTAAPLAEAEGITDVRDEQGEKFSLKRPENKKDPVEISGRAFSLGECFLPVSPCRMEEDHILGYGASRASLLQIALDEMKHLDDSTAVCFTVSYHTLAKAEDILMHRHRPQNAIFLGFCESENKNGLLLLKDGKFFPTKQSLDAIGYPNLPLAPFVSEKAATKAELILPKHTQRLISLALPCKMPLKPTESVSLEAIGNLKKALRGIR